MQPTVFGKPSAKTSVRTWKGEPVGLPLFDKEHARVESGPILFFFGLLYTSDPYRDVFGLAGENPPDSLMNTNCLMIDRRAVVRGT